MAKIKFYYIYIIEILLLICFGIYQIFYLKRLSLENISFPDFLIEYFALTLEYKYIDFSLVIWQVSPIIIFIFFHGTVFYSYWNIDNIYTIIRYKNRSKCFIKSIFNVLGQSVVMSFLFILLLIVLYYLNGVTVYNYNITYMISLLLNLIVLYFSFALIFSWISLNFGSSYGLFFTILFFVIEIVFSLFSIHRLSRITLMLRFILLPMNFFHQIIYSKSSFLYFFVPVFHIIILSLITRFIIMKIDIGINDREAE